MPINIIDFSDNSKFIIDIHQVEKLEKKEDGLYQYFFDGRIFRSDLDRNTDKFIECFNDYLKSGRTLFKVTW